MPQDLKKLMGGRIKAARKALTLSQKDMAAKLGISNSYLSDIETGRSAVGVNFLHKYALEFNISLEFLFYGTGEIIVPTQERTHRKKSFDWRVQSNEDIVWLLEHSDIFRHVIMGYAAKYVFENKDLLKDEIKTPKKEK